MRALLAPLVFSAVAATTTPAPATSATRTPASTRAVSDTARMGAYDLELTTDDGTITGSLTLVRAGAIIDATVVAGGNKPHVKSFVREGHEYVLTGGHDEFTVIYHLRFADDSVSGSFKVSSGLTGTVVGARKH